MTIMPDNNELEKKINDITKLISKLNEEKNIHQLLKTQQSIKNKLSDATKSIKKLKKLADESESESSSSDDSNNELSDSSNSSESNSDSESNSSQKRFATSFKDVKSKMDKMKSEEISIENQIKLKKQLKSELNVLIKLLKNKKLNIIEKK